MDPGESSSRRGRPQRRSSLILTPQIDHDTACENRRTRRARVRAKMGGTRSTGCLRPICTPYFMITSKG
jgi:hypothetical protein